MRKKFIIWLAKLFGVRIFTEPLYTKNIVIPNDEYVLKTYLFEKEIPSMYGFDPVLAKTEAIDAMAKKLSDDNAVEWYFVHDNPMHFGPIIRCKLIIAKKKQHGK